MPVNKNRHSLVDLLIFSPQKFSFVKAVDVALTYQNNKNIPKSINIKSRINYSSKFSDISIVEGVKDNCIEMHVNIQGIAGIEGALPDCYVEEYITHNNQVAKKAISDFFDIFNDKILVLRYRYMKKYDPTCISTFLSKSIFGKIMFCLAGDHQDKALIPEQFNISSQNIFWRNARSAEGLRILLSSFFEIPVKIEQFVGAFVEADKALQTSIGNRIGRFNKLDQDSYLGNKSWEVKNGIRVIVGPLDFEKYTAFLPRKSLLDQRVSKLEKMKEIIRSYIPYGINVSIFFYLNECFVKGTFLNKKNRLNKDSFIFGNHTAINNTSFCERI
ncbi:MAG: type VI secretion system baseplate subunit TssG [Holosporales bacterium]|nr:type VI secretion system baseplate subunit TssG [Holosporales bacterium]